MQCKKCGKLLSGNQKSYCSKQCSKLHLKAGWRKRQREKINEYNRAYRLNMFVRPPKNTSKQRNDLGNTCERCGENKIENLHVHHIRPLQFGGTNHKVNLMLLCRKCHSLWHKLLKPFFFKNPMNDHSPTLSGYSPTSKNPEMGIPPR